MARMGHLALRRGLPALVSTLPLLERQLQSQCRSITAEILRERGLEREVRRRTEIAAALLPRPGERGRRSDHVARTIREITDCTRRRDAAGAFELLARAEETSVALHNAVLNACAKAYEFERAWGLWATMPKKNLISYNIMIGICGSALETRRVDDLWREMQASGVEPNIITYTALIKAYAQSEDADRALEMFGLLKSATPPDAFAFATVMSACARAGDYARTRELFIEMTHTGIAPTNFHFNSLLTACARTGDTAVAEAVFGMMPAYGVSPNEKDYCIMIACCRCDVPRCRELLGELRRRRLEPSSLTLQNLISAELDGGSQEGAAALLAEVRARNLKLTPRLERAARLLAPLEQPAWPSQPRL